MTYDEKTMTNKMTHNWTQYGIELAASARAAHGDDVPTAQEAYQFFLDSPELFTDADEWPAGMPAVMPVDMRDAYMLEVTA